MHNRNAIGYPTAAMNKVFKAKKVLKGKRRCLSAMDIVGEEKDDGFDYFDGLPDDVLLCILAKLASTATSPADLFNVFLTCKRIGSLVMHPVVLSKASAKSLAVRANTWSEYSNRLLRLCVDAGNLEACYILGMIRFYCLGNRGAGISLLAKAAIGLHAEAIYSVAVIQFNGSGGSKADKNLRAGVALCAKAAMNGHIGALRELGHCLQDGYGVRQNVAEGRQHLIQANSLEIASMPMETHTVNRFFVEWFESRGVGSSEDELRLCSYSRCGRLETRRHEFRRCSVCGTVNYCSRACQALDWRLRHKVECVPMDQWPVGADDGGGEVEDLGLHDINGMELQGTDNNDLVGQEPDHDNLVEEELDRENVVVQDLHQNSMAVQKLDLGGMAVQKLDISIMFREENHHDDAVIHELDRNILIVQDDVEEQPTHCNDEPSF